MRPHDRGGARHRAPGIVAHAYYMRSVAQTSLGDPDRRYPQFAALSATRGDREREPDRARAGRLRAGALPRARRTRDASLALFDRSVERGRVGRQPLDPGLRAHREPLDPGAAGRRRCGALVGYRDVIDTWFRGSDWANQWLSLRYVFAILESLGRDEAAAMLYGALEAAGVMQALPLEPSSADEFGLAVEAAVGAARPRCVRRCGRARADLARRGTRACGACRRSTRSNRRRRWPRSTVSAAVQENSSAPWPSPVSGEKYSAKPCSSTSASVRRRRSSASSCSSELLEALDDHPVGVHPGRALPVAVTPGSGGPRRARSAPGTPASWRRCAAAATSSAPAGAGEQRQEAGDGRLRRAARGSPRRASSTACVGSCHRCSSAARVPCDLRSVTDVVAESGQAPGWPRRRSR